ncbi:MAG: SDR family NAD(P)-dependent oxidoreductase [Alphaproteobacteria bacterium]|nr:SDR family NAD(P)-dependent oxidoreductase [Alphaproteobacteria bacterium]MDE2043210.1 SDR family NAD(P)-dependent oxidoreductase [Alphaproteobacteria bacterium]MDE2340050.1 SDR family NAD(P)-dependent oxidoreductase [Alphaproteobacteria bacterium]
MSGVLAGKVALVTGASRGIGAATALALSKAGAHIILVARTSGGLEAVEDQIHASGGTATIAPLDLTDGEALARLVSAIAGRWQALDVLVLNAAQLGTLTPVPHIDVKEWAKTLAINLISQHSLITALDPLLRASTGARVFGLTSSVARNPRAYWGAYGASKAAFENLLLSYAEETRNLSNLKVALIDPGATATQMRAKAFPGEDPATIKAPDVVGSRIAALASEDFETGYFERIG